MWIKELLSEEKPMWTYFAHDIIAHQGPKVERNIPKKIKLNIFLQSFATKKSMLPPDLQRMLNIARETGVRVEGIAFSREILRSRPMWYHAEANPKICLLTRSSASICLRENHDLRTVGEAEETSLLLDDPSHVMNNRGGRCACHNCEAMMDNLGCKNPNECMLRAKDLLDTLPRKWDSRYMLPEDYEDAPTQQNEGFEFDRCVTIHGPVANMFRIFTEGKVCNKLPDLRIAPPSRITYATTGGSYHEAGTSRESRAGAGILTVGEDRLEIALRVPPYLQQTCQVGGAMAA
ncbi:hypothetical protein EDD85DRAFT_740882, partial [Armillaria nabsnona]